MKKIIINNNCTLYNGDCFEIIKDLEITANLVLTDIPYGEVNRKSSGLRALNKEKADVIDFKLEHLVDEIDSICNGSVYIFCGIGQISELRNLLINKKFSSRLCIWEKTNPSPMNGKHIWLSSLEACIYGKKPKATFNEHCKSPVWRFSKGCRKIHPTQKSLPLFKYLIETSSNVGDCVIDPFMGSGTSAIASMQLNRMFIGIEKDEGYFDLAIKNIKSHIDSK